MFIIGRFLGYILFIVIVNPMRLIYKRRHCEYYNTEALAELQDKPFLIVSNHIKPQSKFLKWISMPYDAYILRRMFAQHGISTTAFTSYDSISRAKSKVSAFIKHYVKEPMMKGIVLSIDLIPLNRRKQDKITLKNLKHRIKKGGVGIGIFPEGTWFGEYDPQRKLLPGMSVFGKRYNLPILPVYLHAYDLKSPIDARIGKLIPSNQDSRTIVEQVRAQLNALCDHNWDQIKNLSSESDSLMAV